MVNVNELIASWFSIIFDFVSSLGRYEIVENVNFLGVIIAISIFSIIVKQFFARVTGGN